MQNTSRHAPLAIGFSDLPVGRHNVVIQNGPSGTIIITLVANGVPHVEPFKFTPHSQVTISIDCEVAFAGITAYDSCGQAYQQVVSFTSAESVSSATASSRSSETSPGSHARLNAGHARVRALEDILSRLSSLEREVQGLRYVRQQLLDCLRLYHPTSLIVKRGTERSTDQYLEAEKTDVIREAKKIRDDVAAVDIGLEGAIAGTTAVPMEYIVHGLPLPNETTDASGRLYLLLTAAEAHRALEVIRGHYNSLRKSAQGIDSHLKRVRADTMQAQTPVPEVQALGEPWSTHIRQMADQALAGARAIRVHVHV